MPHYNAELLIKAPAKRLYQALTTQQGIASWWTQDCSIGDDVGARSTFHFGETWKVMRIARLVPDAEVHWTCTDSHIAAPGLKRPNEWIGTRIAFRLVPRGQNHESTLLQFEHIGLTPQIECYALCTSGWHQFLGSLKKYAETGKGMPYAEARAAITPCPPIHSKELDYANRNRTPSSRTAHLSRKNLPRLH